MEKNTNLSSTVILVNNEGMGKADIPLQHMLINKYLNLLLENDLQPAAICLYTDGVKLAVSGSPVFAALKKLEESGVHIILCSTCLDYFGLQEQVGVGIIGGMTDILEAQMMADKVITI